ncbi:MAG: outer membrane protein [Rhizobiaceae bacterium]
MIFPRTAVTAFLFFSGLPGAALAADPIESDPVTMDIPEAAHDEHFFYFDVAGSIGIVIPQNSFEAAAPLNAGGRFQDKIGYGGSLEAGAFVTTNIRLSAEFVYGRIMHDQEKIDRLGGVPINSVKLDLNGETRLFQGFVKAAYETRLSDLGVESLWLQPMSVYALAGIGFSHIENDAILRNAFGPGFDGIADAQDTVLAGKIGAGIVYDITDSLSLVSEYNFVLGQKGDVTLRSQAPQPPITVPIEIETNAHTLFTGIRVKF